MQRCLSLLITLLLIQPVATSATTLPISGAVASAHPSATAAGIEILNLGGNAFDAAVAVTAALAVVEPTGSGLGGGGFWLLHRQHDDHQIMIDGRERAPLAAGKSMYLDQQGEIIPGLSMDGPLAAAIPGTVAAIAHLAKHYGKLPLSTTLAPAIQLAKNGFAVDKLYQAMAKFRLTALQQSPSAAAIFLDNNQVPDLGFVVKQPALAKTLETIAKQGKAGFYEGEIARLLVEGSRQAGGIWTLEDLKQYNVVERAPIQFTYKGMQFTTASPPSSGGVAMATILNILEGYDLAKLDQAERTHLEIEAMRHAYRDRAEFLGDSDYAAVPVARLTSKQHAQSLRRAIDPEKATPSQSLPAPKLRAKSEDTTHFSILDREGNRVAATLSINYPFGAAFVPPGTGVLLNDEMDDFSSKPYTPNAYGLIGTDANAIEPGKRPLSSMSPTFIENKDGVAILGTPGGSRIITMVLRASLAYNEGATAKEMVKLPRIHHQYLPDAIQHEANALDKKTRTKLAAMGHTFQLVEWGFGNMQVVTWDKNSGRVSGASDQRGIGATFFQ